MTFKYNKHNTDFSYILWPIEEGKSELGEKEMQRESGEAYVT